VENTDLIREYISRYFTIKDFSYSPEGSYFITDDYDSENFALLVQDLKQIGYVPSINEYGEDYIINIAEHNPAGKSNYLINLVLFVATVATTIWAGYTFGGGSIVDGIAFSIALMAIIGTHEIAHFFTTRKHGVEATLPYFVPAPTLIGTFGAVINVKSPIPNKNALFDLGVSGPLAGLLVTIPVLFVGIYLSTAAPIESGSTIIIPPLLMTIISYFAAPPVPDGYLLMMHPVAFAGWVGVIVTMLNLMPVAFLDGGHISRSIFNEKIHRIVSFIAIIITLLLGWIPMALLMIIMMFATKKHPGALDNVTELTGRRKILATVALGVLILCLSPIIIPWT
jgi:membrane-associated protease RseP (regulator of RpoE activity)